MQIAVLEEQKKAVEEKVEEQIGEGETNTVTPSSASETKEPTMDEDLQQETEVSHSNFYIDHVFLLLVLLG